MWVIIPQDPAWAQANHSCRASNFLGPRLLICALFSCSSATKDATSDEGEGGERSRWSGTFGPGKGKKNPVCGQDPHLSPVCAWNVAPGGPAGLPGIFGLTRRLVALLCYITTTRRPGFILKMIRLSGHPEGVNPARLSFLTCDPDQVSRRHPVWFILYIKKNLQK